MSRGRATAKKSSTSRKSKPVARKAVTKTARATVGKSKTVQVYQAQKIHLQREADFDAALERGLTLDIALQVAEILKCEWDVVYHYFGKSATIRDNTATLCLVADYIREHGAPGRPYKGQSVLFPSPEKIAAAAALVERKKARAISIAAALKAKKQKAAEKKKKAKPKQTLESIIIKKKTQSRKKPPPNRPTKKASLDELQDIYEDLASVVFDEDGPEKLLEGEVGKTVLIKIKDESCHAVVRVDSVEGAHIIVERSELPGCITTALALGERVKRVRFTRYNVFN